MDKKSITYWKNKVKDFLTDNIIWTFLIFDGGFLSSLREVKKVMIPPKRRFRICDANRFGGHIWSGNVIQLNNCGVMWKDKYNTPRFEGESSSIFGPTPRISITLFKRLRLIIWWEAPIEGHHWSDEDTYWEMWLWYKYYCDSDIAKARDTWGWQSMEGDSTWKEEFLLPSLRK